MLWGKLDVQALAKQSEDFEKKIRRLPKDVPEITATHSVDLAFHKLEEEVRVATVELRGEPLDGSHRDGPQLTERLAPCSIQPRLNPAPELACNRRANLLATRLVGAAQRRARQPSLGSCRHISGGARSAPCRVSGGESGP